MGLLDTLRIPELKTGVPIDDTALTVLHANILQRKPFLKRLYVDFYRLLYDAVAPVEGSVIIELGSGGGFIKEVIAHAVTSDILPVPSVDKVFSALDMPFDDQTIDAFVMIDVLHHIPDVRRFFGQVIRCLKPGGRIAMIEPANTPWAQFIYTHFHHEAFDPTADWTFTSQGPLSSANGALPWIIFHRDRAVFENEFPELTVIECACHTPFRYLFSGGFTLHQLAPSWSYPAIKGIEALLTPLNPTIGLFETIVLSKN